MKLALITGANKGIGYETARQLGAQGLEVIVGARDVARGEAAVARLIEENINAQFLEIDVSNPESIVRAASDLSQRRGALDILINNAGIGLKHWLPSELPMEELKSVMETNFFGAVGVTQAMLPLIRAAEKGRIVNVSSTLGSIFHLSDPHWIAHQHLFTAYSISKSALNSFTALLSAELYNTPIKVNAIEPGYTVTDMTEQVGFQTVEDAAKAILQYALIGDDGPTGGYFDINGRISW